MTGIHAEIVHGRLTSGFPSAGALLLGSDPDAATSWCSGVLIGCQTFLTAAHCVCGTDGARCQGRRAPDAHSRLVYLEHAGFFEVASIAVHPDYHFPVADVAVLRLVRPVTGIAPSQVSTVAPPAGTPGTIVGFGRTIGSAQDFGLKRSGDVTMGPCAKDVSNETSVCWSFDGTQSDTCSGDSGGPLFVDLGAGPAVAGVTSGGSSASCGPGDVAFDASVAHYASWIQAEAGPDLERTICGGLPQVGDPRTAVVKASGSLREGTEFADYAFRVPAGTNELRIALHATDDGLTDFDLFVKRDAPPTAGDYDCAVDGKSQYAYCEFLFPPEGAWYALVQRNAGEGAYQLVATIFGGDPPVCGNGRLETGEECDGSDDGACPGGCDPTCLCTPSCDRGAIVNVRGQLGPRFLVKALVRNDTGASGALDPRTSEFTLTFNEGDTPVEITIPADDHRWIAVAADGSIYQWRGACGAHRVVLRCRRLADGSWQVTLKGKQAAAP